MTSGGSLWKESESSPVSIPEEGSKPYPPGAKSFTEEVFTAQYTPNYRNYYFGITARLWEDDNIGDDHVGSEFIRVGRLVDYIAGRKDFTFTMSGDDNRVRITVLFERANSGDVLALHPPAPSGLKTVEHNHSGTITLSWNRIDDDNVIGYEVSWGATTEPWNTPVKYHKLPART
ncbi:MAG: fibronectin type III domain-containing protein [Spirochaetota bacterium]